MTGIVADVGDQTSACTGLKPRPGQTWSDKFYGTIDAQLTNADSGKAAAVHLTGAWNCKA